MAKRPSKPKRKAKAPAKKVAARPKRKVKAPAKKAKKLAARPKKKKGLAQKRAGMTAAPLRVQPPPPPADAFDDATEKLSEHDILDQLSEEPSH